jgi:hypothetical protein
MKGGTMSDKLELIALLRDEFNRWEVLLAGLSAAQRAAPLHPSHFTVKDTLAHLRAWQQRSIARLEAALEDREPRFSQWPADLDPEPEGEPDDLNAWIYEQNRDRPWATVYAEWRAGFQRLIELAEATPEPNLLEPGRYPWLEGHPLSLVLTASVEHHRVEHREPLQAWLREAGAA